AIPTAIDLTEVYLALSQKAVDAVETPIISVAATKQDEVITTVNATNHVYNAGVLMASKFKFDRLPAAVQAAIRSCVPDLTADWRKTIATKTQEASAQFAGKNIPIVTVDRDAYKAATSAVYQQFKPIVGAELYDAVMGEAAHG
ncbi:MAG: TRAP transporter substrate-binding protein DctP, partial [Alphaproteobacteria bacterium]